jgi:hypothetical protein
MTAGAQREPQRLGAPILASRSLLSSCAKKAMTFSGYSAAYSMLNVLSRPSFLASDYS